MLIRLRDNHDQLNKLDKFIFRSIRITIVVICLLKPLKNDFLDRMRRSQGDDEDDDGRRGLSVALGWASELYRRLFPYLVYLIKFGWSSLALICGLYLNLRFSAPRSLP